MDEYAEKLADAVVSAVVSDDTREGYSYASGLRAALEMYAGRDDARRMLFARGHDY